MDVEAHRHINTSSDSELLLNIFAYNLQQTDKFRINEEDIFKAIGGLMEEAKGAYACVSMLAGFGIIGFRDPNGIRPLGMGSRKSGAGKDYVIASESVVADASGFTDWEDIGPGIYQSDLPQSLRTEFCTGEAVIITRSSVSRRRVSAPAPFAPDIFEYVYLSRPDSVLDGISVYRSRMAMGDALADEVRRVLTEHDISVDVVIPVSGEYHIEVLICKRAFYPGPGHISRRRAKPGSKIGNPLSRGIYKEPICWANVYYAWTTDEVGEIHVCHSCLILNTPPGARTFAKS